MYIFIYFINLHEPELFVSFKKKYIEGKTAVSVSLLQMLRPQSLCGFTADESWVKLL